MEKVRNSAKYRSLRWHYPDQVRSKFNTSSQTVHRLPYLIWTYSNANTRKSQGNCLQKTMKKSLKPIAPNSFLTFLFSLVPGCPFILISDEGNTELDGFFHGLFHQSFDGC